MEEIRNRVAESKLVTVNLEDYYQPGSRRSLDISEWLYEGFILKEKEFRDAVKAHDWEQYEHAFLAVYCTSDAIIPAWAYMLITAQAAPYARRVFYGDLEALEASIYQETLANTDFSHLKDKPVIVKGCSEKPVPQNAYLLLIQHLQPLVKSLLYGEACSSVPLYKRK
ncbi:DUF2480 family protein [Robertkochia aurantiaca]|uniref:DUF2480 family protein n=1 Tax=Robertkochia aurantiaca TaxID=2873700 RepID=UPI001CCD2D66|nr:DUF2480 family protein [Robertkochia sp. 3YJGBD-33]